ncbi:MAG: hypothetical protein LBT83_11050 [Tannerella sp.]|jgi:uncharacterized membrane protein HdeD (DUF308 family)|nr:hypothetical protein [Tannerella sp.]
MSVLKYVGVLVLLIGVAILAVPTLRGELTNTYLLVGLFLIVFGYIGHIFLNKKIES